MVTARLGLLATGRGGRRTGLQLAGGMLAADLIFKDFSAYVDDELSRADGFALSGEKIAPSVDSAGLRRVVTKAMAEAAAAALSR